MFETPLNKYLVPYDQSFNVADAPTRVEHDFDKLKSQLETQVERIAEAQRMLYADNRFSVLLVFQAMDAAGKDSTIRAALSGVNPAGCHVSSFKKPSENELEQDFLWRTTKALPQRGRIGVYNRSYYEEVLVVRVHPKILTYQRIPDAEPGDAIWAERLHSIREQELHLARNGTVIVKFWLNVSRTEQHKRFLSRLSEPRKIWKFSAGDLDESEHWDDYMAAYEDALNETSRPWAPWFAIPADDKAYMRYRVARTIADTLEALPIAYPEPDSDIADNLEHYKQRLIV